MIAPEPETKSQLTPAVPDAAERSTRMAPPLFSVNVPHGRFVLAAAALVGSTVPVTVRLPTLPEPDSVAPEATVTAEFESEPLRITRPPEIIVAPFRVLWPDNVKVPARLVSVPEPLRMPA